MLIIASDYSLFDLKVTENYANKWSLNHAEDSVDCKPITVSIGLSVGLNYNQNKYEPKQLVTNATISTTMSKTKNITKPCILERIVISSKTLIQSQLLLMFLSANTYSTKLPRTTKPIKQ